MLKVLFDPEKFGCIDLDGHVRNELLDAYEREGDPFPERTNDEVRLLASELDKACFSRALLAACIGRAASMRGLIEELRPLMEIWTTQEPGVLPAFDTCQLDSLPSRVDAKKLEDGEYFYWSWYKREQGW